MSESSFSGLRALSPGVARTSSPQVFAATVVNPGPGQDPTRIQDGPKKSRIVLLLIPVVLALAALGAGLYLARGRLFHRPPVAKPVERVVPQPSQPPPVDKPSPPPEVKPEPKVEVQPPAQVKPEVKAGTAPKKAPAPSPKKKKKKKKGG